MAKEGKASLLIELKDNASEGLKKIKEGVDDFKVAMGAAVAAGAAIIAFLTKATLEYAQQETAIERLNVALRNAGIAGDGMTQKLIEQADALQKSTGFADDAIISMDALGARFGFTGKQLEQITPRVLDLAAATGMDLNSAMVILGKSIELGSSAMLKRYGIVIDDSILKSRDFNAIMGALDAKFKGTAETLNGTVNGSFTQFRLAIQDMMKAIGALVAGPAQAFLTFLTSATQKVAELFKWMGPSNDVMKETIGLTQAQSREYVALGRSINDLVALAKAEGRDLNPIEAERLVALTNRKKALQDLAKEKQRIDAQMTKQEGIGAKEELKAVDDQTHKLMTKFQTRGDQRLALAALFGANEAQILANGLTQQENEELIDQVRRLDALGMFHDSEVLQEQAVQFARQQLNKKRIEDLNSTLSFISSLSSAKNKELAAIGKAAAIGTATVDTYQAANKALASAPPPWNFALAAAVVAAGLTNVARIVGVQMAEGGVVLPRAGGTLATIGEAGSAEAVIPLNDPKARAMLGGAGGGANITIQAGVFMGSQADARRFAKMIDRELFHLKRNGQAVS